MLLAYTNFEKFPFKWGSRYYWTKKQRNRTWTNLLNTKHQRIKTASFFLLLLLSYSCVNLLQLLWAYFPLVSTYIIHIHCIYPVWVYWSDVYLILFTPYVLIAASEEHLSLSSGRWQTDVKIHRMAQEQESCVRTSYCTYCYGFVIAVVSGTRVKIVLLKGKN